MGSDGDNNNNNNNVASNSEQGDAGGATLRMQFVERGNYCPLQLMNSLNIDSIADGQRESE